MGTTQLSAKFRRFLAIAVSCSLVACFVASCASSSVGDDVALPMPSAVGARSPSAQPIPAEAGYSISAGDKLRIQFPFHPTYNSTAIVRPDGRISMVLLGSVMAAGKTTDELQRDLSTSYLRAEGGDNIPSMQLEEKKHYYINPGDLLEVKFTYHKELDDKVIVRPDGRISLVMVNSVIAEGRTPEELAASLQKAYKKYIKDPELVVIVRRFTSEQYYVDGHIERPRIMDLDKVVVNVIDAAPMEVYVGGEVARPGYLPYRGTMTALEAIISAGGDTNRADLSQVAVLRELPNHKGELLVRNLRFDKVGGGIGGVGSGPLATAAQNDIRLQPYDVIIVPKSGIASFDDYLDQYLYKVVRPLANSSFAYVYGQYYVK